MIRIIIGQKPHYCKNFLALLLPLLLFSSKSNGKDGGIKSAAGNSAAIARSANEMAMKAGEREQKKGLRFIANKTQWPSQVLYKTDVPGGSIFFTANSFRYGYYSLGDLNELHEKKHKDIKAYDEKIDCHAYDVNFIGANTAVAVSGFKKQAFYHNYFLGNDPAKWSGEVPVYEGISYDELWNGIDLNIYSSSPTMKYDFVVAAGADASQVLLRFDGVSPVIDKNGDLVIHTSVNTVCEKAPYTYQIIGGKKLMVPSKYVIKENGAIGFAFPKGYNKAAELVIDPTLVFGTYSGGTALTFGWSATYDLTGSLYAGGECFGTGWPVTTGSFQTTFGGGIDCSINKYTSDGTALVYSTYYGGSDSEFPNTMVVNDANELIMAGLTVSGNLPTTTGCYDNSINGGNDIYVAHFNAAGSALLGSTYIGGSLAEQSTRGEVLTANGDIYVCMSTNSSNFPTTAGAYQTTYGGGTSGGSGDGLIFKMNGTCSNLIWSTYLGGSSDDNSYAMVLNSAGNVVVTGNTESTNFPTTPGVLHPTSPGGFSDAYITILNATGTGIVQSTFIGTAGSDMTYKIQVDPSDNVYVVGTTDGNYPISAGVYSNAGANVFVDKLSPTLSTSLLSTRLGSAGGFLTPSAFLYDVCGNVYVAGQGASSGSYPVTANAFQTTAGGFWFCVLTTNMSSLLYATYMGASFDHNDGGSSRFDPQGIVYHSVCNCGGGFPTTPTAWAPTGGGAGCDIASFKFNFEAIGVIAKINISTSTASDTGCVPFPVSLINNTTGATDYLWDFGDGSPTSTLMTPPTHVYNLPGTYTITLFASNNNPNSCSGADTAYYTIMVLDTIPLVAQAALTVSDTGCIPYNAGFINTSIGATTYEWDFGDGSPVSNTFQPTHNYTLAGNYIIRLIVTNPAACAQRDTTTIPIFLLDTHPTASILLPQDDTGCASYTVNMINNSTDASAYLWDFGDGTTDMSASPPAHTYILPGIYHVVLHAFNPALCHTEDVDSVTISVFQIDAPILTLKDTLVCDIGNVALTAPTTSTTGNLAFHWAPASAITGSPDQQSITANAIATTMFTVSVTDSIGSCKKTTSAPLLMTVFDASIFRAFADTTICPGDTAAFIGTGGDFYAWSPDLDISSINTPAVQVWPGSSAIYTVTISNTIGCVKEREVHVTLHPALDIDAGADQDLRLGDVAHLEVTGTEGNPVTWYPVNYLTGANSTTPLVNPPATSQYFVTAKSPDGCFFTDSVTVHVVPVMIPTAFSPNGDGKNDFFNMRPNNERVRLLEISVYDRWGKRIWKTNHINDGWDGTYEGTQAEVGVYFYYVDFAIGSKRYQMKGDVTLIR